MPGAVATAGLAQSFGAFDVFSGLTANLPNDGKVGLVGPNGIGKTSLLLILAGLEQPGTERAVRATARGRRLRCATWRGRCCSGFMR